MSLRIVAVPHTLEQLNSKTWEFRLSAVLSPSLDSAHGDTLAAQAHEWFTKWPDTAFDAGNGGSRPIHVAVNIGTTRFTKTFVAFAAPPLAALQDLWGAFFHAGRPVRAPSRPDASTKITTYSVDDVDNTVRHIYSTGSTNTYLATSSNKLLPVNMTSVGDTVAAKSEFHDFHERIKSPLLRTHDTYDVHEVLSLLGQYPFILRQAGLVLDLVVTASEAQRKAIEVSADRTLSVEFAFMTSQKPKSVKSLKTRFVLDSPATTCPYWRFLAAPADDAETHNRFLRLGDTRFDTHVIDLAAAMRKLAVVGKATKASPDNPGGLPLIRSGGVTVFRNGRGAAVTAKLERATQLYAGTVPALDEGDLIRGYAIDVLDRGEWRPLCARQSSYSFAVPGGGTRTLAPSEHYEDEGFITASAAPLQPAADAAATGAAKPAVPELAVHEALFTWDGWSLAIPRPACIGSTGAAPGVGADILHASFTQPSDCMLPRLLFGNTYLIRARAVDLAGNRWSMKPSATAASASVHFTDTQDAVAAKTIIYQRYQSPRPPSLHALDDAPAIGSKEPRGRDVKDLILKTGQGDVSFFLAPPAINLDVLLEHPEILDARGRRISMLDVNICNLLPPLVDTANRDALQPQWSSVFWNHRLPFFRDPIVDRALVRGLPTSAAGATHATYDGEAFVPFGDPAETQIVLRDGTRRAAPRYEVVGSILYVYLLPGEDVPTLISSCISALGHLMLGVVTDAKSPTMAAAVQSGHNETVCPSRAVHLTYALDRPDLGPELLHLTAARVPRGTSATLDCSARLDPAQSGTFALEASWRDVLDVPAGPPPARRLYVKRAAQATIDAGPLGVVPVPLPALIHEFGDTRARLLDYTPIAGSRYSRFYPPSVDTARTGAPKPVHIPSTVKPPVPTVVQVVPIFGWQPETGVREGTSTRLGSAVRIYFERPWFASGDGEGLAVLLPPSAAAWDAVKNGNTQTYYSLWGRDPIWPEESSDGPLFLTPAHFPNTMTLTDLRILGAAGSSVPADAALYTFDPDRNFNSDRALWYCDVVIDFKCERPPYSPFLRLALARFQRTALDGLTLSDAVQADFVQLANRRTATLARHGKHVSLTLEGSFAAGSTVEVVCQGHDGEDASVGWRDLNATPVPMTPTVSGWKLDWEVPGCGQRRLVLRESEMIGSAARIVYFDIFDW